MTPEAPWGTPPGEILRTMLADRGLTQLQAAVKMGRPKTLLSCIVTGRKAITPETALDLEIILDVPAEYWVDLEARYRLRLARERRADGEPNRHIPHHFRRRPRKEAPPAKAEGG